MSSRHSMRCSTSCNSVENNHTATSLSLFERSKSLFSNAWGRFWVTLFLYKWARKNGDVILASFLTFVQSSYKLGEILKATEIIVNLKSKVSALRRDQQWFFPMIWRWEFRRFSGASGTGRRVPPPGARSWLTRRVRVPWVTDLV